MTEQSKIPLPPKGEGNDEQGNSLFERASGAFGGFKPAPVPADLATPATRRARKVTLEEVVETVEQTAAPLEGTEQEATAGAVLTVEPVHFNGVFHWQLFHQRFNESGDDHGGGFRFGHAATHQVKQLFFCNLRNTRFVFDRDLFFVDFDIRIRITAAIGIENQCIANDV